MLRIDVEEHRELMRPDCLRAAEHGGHNILNRYHRCAFTIGQGRDGFRPDAQVTPPRTGTAKIEGQEFAQVYHVQHKFSLDPEHAGSLRNIQER